MNSISKKLLTSLLSVFCMITSTTSLFAKNPTYQDFFIVNRSTKPINIVITASYKDTMTGKTNTDKTTVSLAPQAYEKFTYRRNKFIKGNAITYSGGLQSITINGKTYTTTIGADGNQYFAQAQMPAGFSYNTLNIFPNNILKYNVTNLVVR